MIYRLQRRFILICTASVFSVVVIIFAAILLFNTYSTNQTLDVLADSVSAGGGRFPTLGNIGHKPGILPPNGANFDFITPETPFSTRHFTVYFDKNGKAIRTHTDAIYAIDKEQAVTYAKEVVTRQRERGWYDSYRYKVFQTEFGTGVVFIDGSANRAILAQSMTISAIVLLSCGALVLLLIILFSKRAIKPIAESYEKQRQFVTDANHELKTPLTLILANLDIAEEELGQNEWLDDIRAEGHRMTELVNQLVALSRMDEDSHALHITDVPLGQMVQDTVSEFEALANIRGKALEADVDAAVTTQGDETLLRQLIGILMDNAIKYCDPDGIITVKLHRQRRIHLMVENTYSAVDQLELHRLFDRFYRADKARSFTGGYGVGLSMAKAITEKHKGEIIAYKKDDAHIGFQVIL